MGNQQGVTTNSTGINSTQDISAKVMLRVGMNDAIKVARGWNSFNVNIGVVLDFARLIHVQQKSSKPEMTSLEWVQLFITVEQQLQPDKYKLMLFVVVMASKII
jgi:hypothetical protein